jgi:palmitoyl transferase
MHDNKITLPVLFSHFLLTSMLTLIGTAIVPEISLAQTQATADTPSILSMPELTDTPMAAPTAPQQQSWWMRDLNNATTKTEDIYDNGRLSLYLSGYAHHGRGTYTPDRIAELNEKTWGLGMSKEMRDDKDNEESLLFIVMADSHYSPQITAGYQYEWMKPVGSKYEAGIGYVAGLISRADIFNGVPFPGALPVASFGTRDTKLMFTYLPRLTKNKGNGDILFFSLRTNLK